MVDDLLFVSVKQLEQVLGCPRQWAAHNLFDVPYCWGEHSNEGNQVHDQIKCMGRGMPLPHPPESPVGKMAKELFQTYAATRSEQAVFEMHHTVALPEYGIKVALRCDFADAAVPKFVDWKVTGADGKNARLRTGEFWTLQTIEHDVQMNVYAFLLMHRVWEVPEIAGQMAFVCRKFADGKTPKVWDVPHVFRYGPTKAWWDTYVPPAVELIRELQSAKLDNLLQVPHNAKHCEFSGKFCDAAGRCQFRSSPVMKYADLHLPVLRDGKET